MLNIKKGVISSFLSYLSVGVMLGVVFQQGQTGLLYIVQTQANYHKPVPAVKSNTLREE